MNAPRSFQFLLIPLLFVLSLQGARAQQPSDVDKALQKAFERFPVVRPKKDARGNAEFTSVTLNKMPVVVNGVRYDGFRFRTDKRGDFVWAFNTSSNVTAWYITPKTGVMQGFQNFYPTSDYYYQALSGDALEPGKTYLIWFSIQGTKATKVNLAFTFADLQADAAGSFALKDIKQALFPNPK
jgi:hypothetical protein